MDSAVHGLQIDSVIDAVPDLYRHTIEPVAAGTASQDIVHLVSTCDGELLCKVELRQCQSAVGATSNDDGLATGSYPHAAISFI